MINSCTGKTASFLAYNHKSAFIFCYVLRNKVPLLWFLASSCWSLNMESWFCFWFSLSMRCINFGAICLVSKFSLRMHRNVTYNAHIMLQMPLNERRLRWRLTSPTSCAFLSVRLEAGHQRSKSKNPTLVTFGNANVWVQRSYKALNTNTRARRLHKNETICYSDNHHTYSQYITSAVPSDTQQHYTWLALHAASRKTSGSHM